MNVPQLRFDGFDGEWEVKKFSEVATIKGGFAFPSQRFKNTKSNYQVIKMGNLYNNKLDLGRSPSFLESISDRDQEYLLNEGDIIITLTGTVHKTDFGYSHMITNEENLLVNQRLALIKSKTNSDSFFLLNLIRHKRFLLQFFTSSIGGTGNQANVSTKTMESFNIVTPSLLEQKKISTFFTLLDRRINKQHEKIEKLEQLKKGMMQKIFSQELRFKDEDGREFPEWETKQLKESATKKVKKNKDMKVTNVISNSAKQGLISQRSYFKKDIANELNIDGYYVISKGDFVYNPRISSESPYGPVHVYELEDDGIVSPLYLCFKTKNIDSKFLKYFFMSSQWHKHIYTHGDSGARHDRVSIKDSNFFEMKIAMPSMTEQEKISDYLTSLDYKVEKEKEKLMVLEEQKKGFMWGMFV